MARCRRKTLKIGTYYPIPEEGFSFFEIQTPLENLTPQKPKGPFNPANLKPLHFQTQNAPPPPHHLGGGGGAMVDMVDKAYLSYQSRGKLDKSI